MNLAGRELRILNFIFDYMAVTFVFMILVIPMPLIAKSLSLEFTPFFVKFGVVALYILLYWAYYFLMEHYMQGKTLGKMLTKTRVVTAEGTQPDFWSIFVRTLARGIPFEFLTYLVTLTGVHDKMSGTFVVKDLIMREQVTGDR